MQASVMRRSTRTETYDVFAYAAMRARESTESFIKARMSFIRNFTFAMARWNAEMLSEDLESAERDASLYGQST